MLCWGFSDLSRGSGASRSRVVTSSALWWGRSEKPKRCTVRNLSIIQSNYWLVASHPVANRCCSIGSEEHLQAQEPQKSSPKASYSLEHRLYMRYCSILKPRRLFHDLTIFIILAVLTCFYVVFVPLLHGMSRA